MKESGNGEEGVRGKVGMGFHGEVNDVLLAKGREGETRRYCEEGVCEEEKSKYMRKDIAEEGKERPV